MASNAQYDIVLIDPAWYYWGSPTKMAAAGKHYDLIPDEDMLRLDIGSYLKPKHSIAFIWATGPRKDFAFECIKAWGLHYRGEAFHWIKTRKDGVPVGAQGVRASITKPTVETVLAASFMPKGRPLKIADESVAQTIFAPETDLEPASIEDQVIYAPRGEHSEKPEELYRRIERMYPDASKVEIFARKARPGWDAVGNQLDPPSLVRMREPGAPVVVAATSSRQRAAKGSASGSDSRVDASFDAARQEVSVALQAIRGERDDTRIVSEGNRSYVVSSPSGTG